MSIAVNQELVDTMLLLESGLDALDERLGGPREDEILDAAESVQGVYLRLANQLREVVAALDYCMKVNRQVASLQDEGAAQLLAILEELEAAEAGDPPGTAR